MQSKTTFIFNFHFANPFLRVLLRFETIEILTALCGTTQAGNVRVFASVLLMFSVSYTAYAKRENVRTT